MDAKGIWQFELFVSTINALKGVPQTEKPPDKSIQLLKGVPQTEEPPDMSIQLVFYTKAPTLSQGQVNNMIFCGGSANLEFRTIIVVGLYLTIPKDQQLRPGVILQEMEDPEERRFGRFVSSPINHVHEDSFYYPLVISAANMNQLLDKKEGSSDVLILKQDQRHESPWDADKWFPTRYKYKDKDNSVTIGYLNGVWQSHYHPKVQVEKLFIADVEIPQPLGFQYVAGDTVLQNCSEAWVRLSGNAQNGTRNS